MSEWISVNDRLPEQRRVYDDERNPDNYYMNSEKVLVTDGKEITIATRCNDDWDDWGQYPFTVITHWMPMPKLPEGEKTNE